VHGQLTCLHCLSSSCKKSRGWKGNNGNAELSGSSGGGSWNAEAWVEGKEDNDPQEDGWTKTQHLVLDEAGMAMDCSGEGLSIRGCVVVGSDSLWLPLLMSEQTDCLRAGASRGYLRAGMAQKPR
jgi:hypothetical protein